MSWRAATTRLVGTVHQPRHDQCGEDADDHHHHHDLDQAETLLPSPATTNLPCHCSALVILEETAAPWSAVHVSVR
jgi:hypothetical protein